MTRPRRGEVNRMRARVLAIVLVVAGFFLVAPGLARGDGPDRPAPRVTYVLDPGPRALGPAPDGGSGRRGLRHLLRVMASASRPLRRVSTRVPGAAPPRPSGGQVAVALERGFGGVVLRREPRSSSSRSKSAGSWKSL